MLRFSAAERLASAVVLGALLLSAPANAASFTVQNGQTVGQQWLTDPGDTGTVKHGGTVSATGDFTQAIIATGPNNTVTNRGTVTTNGDYSPGIYGTGDNFVVNNWGSISGSGYNAAGIYATSGQYAVLNNWGSIYETGISLDGIFSYGPDARITNGGTITLEGDPSNSSDASGGIVAEGDRAVVLNTGDINVTANFAEGLFAWSNDASLTNRGTINLAGYSTNGMYSAYSSNTAMVNTGTIISHGTSSGYGMINAWGNNGTIANSGTIDAAGSFAVGIYSAFSSNITIINTGTIVANGDSAIGVLQFTGGNVTLINSGTIIATSSSNIPYAIEIWGGGSVSLLAHTALQGDIYFEDPGSLSLNIGTGLNTALTFANGFPLPDTNGQPAVIDGNLLAVVDPTGLAAVNSFGFDLTRSIADAVEGHLGAPGADALTTAALPGQSSAAGRGYWASGLGSYNQYAGQGSLDGYHDGAAGMITGLDRWLSASTSAGLFGGVSAGVIQTAADSTNINAVGAFAGGYWSHDDGKAFTHVSLAGGALDNNSDRTVANNLVDGGLETASAEYGSFYVSPALTLGLHHDVGGAIVSPSIGVRYAGLYRGGYTETGSAANVTAGSGTAQALDVRGELRADFAAKVSAAGVLRYNARAGVDGVFSRGGAVDGQLLGTDITLLAGGQTSVARGYLGGGMTFSQANGTRLNTDVQASYDTADTFALSAQAGLSGAF